MTEKIQLTENVFLQRPMTPEFGVQIQPMIPDTHTARFYDELYRSLVVTVTKELPEGQSHYDINDVVKIKVTVMNNYEYSDSMVQIFKRVPDVVFENITVKILSTSNATVLPSMPKPFPLNLWDRRLEPGDIYTTERSVKITSETHYPTDPMETLAKIEVNADLDLKAFFHVEKKMDAYVQVREP